MPTGLALGGGSRSLQPQIGEPARLVGAASIAIQIEAERFDNRAQNGFGTLAHRHRADEGQQDGFLFVY